MGGRMLTENNPSIEMIRVDQVNILNPRVRNPKVFEGIVHNIKNVGLKRPITVTSSNSKIPGKDYDLVCGQGRLEAFLACGQELIPAMIIDASEEQALIMSLVENVARRRHRPIELLQGVEILRTQGYDAKIIAQKVGHTTDYIQGVIRLLEQGEERLVTAVEFGYLPITLAVNIMTSPKDEQKALQDAYESKQLSGHKLMAAKRILALRRKAGKELDKRGKRVTNGTYIAISPNEILKAYKREVERKKLLARKAEIASTRLLFLVEAMHCLMKEDHFTTLLRAENLETMPKQLSHLIAAKGK